MGPEEGGGGASWLAVVGGCCACISALTWARIISSRSGNDSVGCCWRLLSVPVGCCRRLGLVRVRRPLGRVEPAAAVLAAVEDRAERRVAVVWRRLGVLGIVGRVGELVCHDDRRTRRQEDRVLFTM